MYKDFELHGIYDYGQEPKITGKQILDYVIIFIFLSQWGIIHKNFFV